MKFNLNIGKTEIKANGTIVENEGIKIETEVTPAEMVECSKQLYDFYMFIEKMNTPTQRTCKCNIEDEIIKV